MQNLHIRTGWIIEYNGGEQNISFKFFRYDTITGTRVKLCLFRVPVSKLVEVVLHVGKGAKFGVEKVNGGQIICNRVASVGNGKNFEKQAQCSKG